MNMRSALKRLKSDKMGVFQSFRC